MFNNISLSLYTTLYYTIRHSITLYYVSNTILHHTAMYCIGSCYSRLFHAIPLYLTASCYSMSNHVIIYIMLHHDVVCYIMLYGIFTCHIITFFMITDYVTLHDMTLNGILLYYITKSYTLMFNASCQCCYVLLYDIKLQYVIGFQAHQIRLRAENLQAPTFPQPPNRFHSAPSAFTLRTH